VGTVSEATADGSAAHPCRVRGLAGPRRRGAL